MQMSFPTRTPAVGSHAEQRRVSSETVRRATAPGSATGVSDGRARRSHTRAMARHGWATQEVAAGHVRRDGAHDAITTVEAIVGDDVTTAVLVITRGDVVGVSYAADGLDLSVGRSPSREQR
jgi:hypothetical protein